MFKKVFFQRVFPIPLRVVKKIIEENKADNWFYYVVEKRKERWEILEPSYFIKKNIPKDAAILETGCGCASNLLWFGWQGFNNLYGTDNNENCLRVGEDLANYLNVKLNLWSDDSLDPHNLPERKFDVIMALNWTYYLSKFDLKAFLNLYSNKLTDRGILVIDTIDKIFDTFPNNQFLSSDANKPIAERRPSEYVHRISKEEFLEVIKNLNLRIVKSYCKKFKNNLIPRRVYILAKI